MKRTAIALTAALVLLPAATAFAGGAETYKAKCVTCHGADGAGQTPMGKKLNLRHLGSPEVQKQTDQQLFDITAKGKGKMPAYAGKISDADIKALVAFMRTLKK
jgi:mono/diheme cytochrome c family protein